MTTEQTTTDPFEGINPDTFNWNDAGAYAALGIGTPEPDEEIEEQEEGDTGPAPAAAPAPAPAAAAPAPAPAPTESSQAPAAAPAPAEPDRVDGIATVDGKRVIPYAVLQATRAEAREQRAEAERLKQELQQVRDQLATSGNQALADRAASAPETLTAEELAELEQDFPSMAKPLRVIRALQDQLRQQTAAPAPAPAPAAAAPAPAPAAPVANSEEEFDAALAASPLISKWMTAGGPEWERAQAIDRVLMEDPRNANLTYAQRFAKVERMVAAEFEIPLPAAPGAAPAPAAAAPAAAPAAPAQPAVKPAALPSLTDLGGSPPQSGEDAINSKTALDLLAATENMTEQQLMQMAGVLY